MDENNNATLSQEPTCAKCQQHEADLHQVAILFMAVLFIAPIIGMVVGLFAGKKLNS